MKTVILVASLLITIKGICQNGGQYPENGSLKLEYIGGGKVKLTNKLSATSVIKLNDGMTEGDLSVPGNSFVIYILPPALLTNIHVKAKNISNCQAPDCGWVELVLSSLALKFTSFDLKNEYGPLCKASIKVADVVNVNKFYIMVSTDGVTWIKKDSIKAIPNGTDYFTTIKL